MNGKYIKGTKIRFTGIGRAGKTMNIKDKTMADWEIEEYNIEQNMKRQNENETKRRKK